MIVYPAMDLIGGRCVRLRQGRFDEASVYAPDPAGALTSFEAEGALWAHVVDLDGARAGEPAQHALLTRLARSTNLHLQAAGGIRTRDQAAALLDGGVARVVIGSLAVEDPGLVGEMIEEFGAERVALALDVNLVAGTPVVATRGWTQSSSRSLFDVALLHPEARHLIVTDIGRDGMLQGPSLGLIKDVIERLPDRTVQASGGISSLGDILALSRLGAAGAIVGKALWEGEIDLAEAVRIAGA